MADLVAGRNLKHIKNKNVWTPGKPKTFGSKKKMYYSTLQGSAITKAMIIKILNINLNRN